VILACTVRLRGMSERRSWRWTRGLSMRGRRRLAIIVGGMVFFATSRGPYAWEEGARIVGARFSEQAQEWIVVLQ
jgi:hypothetical protein